MAGEEMMASNRHVAEDGPATDADGSGEGRHARADAVGGHGLPEGIAALPSADRRQAMRAVEALIFASPMPLSEAKLSEHLPDGTDVPALLSDLQAFYAGRGVVLVQIAGGWMFQTAEDLAFLQERHIKDERRLSKAALETLAIIAYHQPCTRAEIEEVRGVSTSKGTLDALMDIGWIRPRGRRRAPGRPVTYGTTDAFLIHFSLDKVSDLPGMQDLKGAGLLDADLPPDFTMPNPQDVADLLPDELPLEDPDHEEGQEELDLPIALDEASADHDTDGNDETRDDGEASNSR